MASLARGMVQAGAQLHIFALNTTKHFINLNEIGDEVRQYNLEAHNIDNDINFANTLANLFSGDAFHVSRFFDSAVNGKLQELLSKEQFDLVVFESIFMAPYLNTVRQHSKARCVLRSHNIEYRIWERVVQETTNPAKKAYLKLQKERLRKYERSLTAQFDLVAAITPVDARYYEDNRLNDNVITLPFGIDAQPRPIEPDQSNELKIGFLGSMDWIPNQEGIRWFIDEIWPELSKALPQLICKIGGRHMPNDIMEKADVRLQIIPEVKSATEFLKEFNLVIVPLRSGSGVRIKVLESMANGIPVLSTTIGYEGINARADESILKANTPEEFVSTLKKVSENPQILEGIAEKALQLIRAEHDSKQSAIRLFDEVSKLKSLAG